MTLRDSKHLRNLLDAHIINLEGQLFRGKYYEKVTPQELSTTQRKINQTYRLQRVLSPPASFVNREDWS